MTFSVNNETTYLVMSDTEPFQIFLYKFTFKHYCKPKSLPSIYQSSQVAASMWMTLPRYTWSSFCNNSFRKTWKLTCCKDTVWKLKKKKLELLFIGSIVSWSGDTHDGYEWHSGPGASMVVSHSSLCETSSCRWYRFLSRVQTALQLLIISCLYTDK